MGNAHEVLSYTISAEDKASAVFRGVGAEITKLSQIAERGLSGISRDMTTIGGKKSLEFVKTDQALALAQTESQMAKLQKTTSTAGVATKLQAAEMDVLVQKHRALQREMDKTATQQKYGATLGSAVAASHADSHAIMTKAATVASYGILGAGVAIIADSVKQGVAWEDLGKKIKEQTGLSESGIKGLMGTINNVTGTVPYKLNEISAAAVLLKTKFHESDPQIEKSAGLMAAFAQRSEREVTPAVTGLLSIMQDYREPLGDVVDLTDKLTSVSQATQKPMGELLNVVERYGPKLQAMGFGLNESIGLLGVFQESGISTSMMGRGLSQALTTADKQLGVTASNPSGNPPEALAKESLALEKARATVLKYNETIPKTVAQQNQLDRERKIATQELENQEKKYTSLKKAIEQSGGAHATIASIIKGEISQIEHAKTSQEAYSIAIADFGKQTGPSFARAFYHNEAAIKAVDKALGEHGSTSKLVKAEEETLGGQVIKIDETWKRTERTLSVDLLPALGEFLKLVSGGVDDIEKFVKGNTELSTILGGGAMVGSAGFLVRKPIVSAAKDIGGVVSKITGIGGSSGSTFAGEISGVRGTTLPGSLTNPIYTRQEGGSGGGSTSSTGAKSSEEKRAEEDAKKAEKGGLSKITEKLEQLAGGGGIAAAGKKALGGIAGGAAEDMTAGALVAAGGEGAVALAIGAALPFASAAAARAMAEALHPGMAKEHSLREIQQTYLGGQRPETGLSFAGVASPEASGVGQQGAKAYVESTMEEVEANKLLFTSTTRIQQAEEELATMRQQGETHSARYRATLKELSNAEGEHAKGIERLMSAAAHSTGAVHVQIEQQIAKLNGTLASNPSSSVRASALSNWQSLTSGIGGEMSATLGVVSKGVGSINKQLLEEVKALNGGKVSSLGEGGPPLAPGVEKALTGHATGGRVPGAVGPDNWTLIDPSGRPAAKVGGAELLIANRHTEAAASEATMAYYGMTLGQMVAGERTPHSAATGGRFVADPGTNFSVGEEPRIVADLEKLAAKEGWTIYGISGYRSPQHSVEVGGFANDPHTRGEAADVGINSQSLESAAVLTAAMLASVGLERPFYPASPHEINHVQLLGSGSGGGAREPLQESLAKAAARIKAPKWTGPGGELGRIGRGVLSKVTRAANAKLGHAGSTMGGLAGFHGGGSPNANETLGRQMMLAAGWGANEWPDLQALWTQESGWNANAVNPSSGAYGIPQSLGHGHPYNLGDAAAQIAWGLNYIKERYGSPALAEAHEQAFKWYDKGGRLNYAGAFEHGGVVTASSPTMAVFGEKGTETALFLPHAATGIRLGSSGLGETEGVNPNTGDIEYHTQEEWAQIRLQHSSQTKKEALYKKAHPGSKKTTPSYEDLVQVAGLAAGLVTMPSKQTFDLPSDISKLSASVWAKVVAAIEKTLKSTPEDRVAVAITGKISEEHGARAHTLAGKAIEQSGKTVMGILKNAPEEQGIVAGNQATGALKKLIADAHKSGNEALVTGLRKDLETTLKTTASRIVKTAEAAPPARAPGADSTAVGQLWTLVSKARGEGNHTIELSLLKDAQKTIKNWHTAIGTKFTQAQKETTTHETLKIANQTFDTIKKQGAGVRLKASAQTDPAYLKEEEANAAKAEKEYAAERAQIAKLLAKESEEIKKLQAKEAKERKAHHKAAANAIEATIRLMESQLSEAREQYDEVSTAIEETKINVAELRAEHEKAVEQALKEQIDETNQIFETHLSQMQLAETLEEGKLHREGLDFSGLEEDKSKQEGELTPAQIAQARSDYAMYKSHHEEQIREDERQRSYDESQLGGLSGEDRQALEKTIEGLTSGINDLQNQIYDQGKATEKLTEATNANTKVLGGNVGFTFNGQQYLAGGNASQSSNSAADISVGI